MAAESLFIKIADCAKIMDCSYTTAWKCAREINTRLRSEGKFTISGKVNRQAFYRAIMYTPPNDDDTDSQKTPENQG